MKFFLLCVALYLVGAESSILPERLSKYVCKKSDPDYPTCYRNSMEKVRSDIIKGIPEIGFAGIEPLATASTKLNRSMGFGTGIKMYMENSTVSGFSKAIIEKVTADPNTLFGQIDFVLPTCQFNTQIDAEGSILWIPVDAEGDYEGHFKDVRIQMTVQFHKYQKNGVWYFGLNLDDVTTWMHIGSGTIRIKAVNAIQQFAADLFCNWYNANFELIDHAIAPILGDLVNDFIGKQIADYVSRVPAAELLPE